MGLKKTQQGMMQASKRACIICDEAITDKLTVSVTIDRSKGYGKVGLAHDECIKKNLPK